MQTASTCFQTVEQYGVFQKELTPVEARQKSDVWIWVDIGYKHECNPKRCMSNPLTSHGHYDVETCNWTGCTGSSWNADKPSWSRTASPGKTIRTALIFQSGSLVDHEVAEEPSWNSDWCSWSRKLMSLAGPKHLPAVVGRCPAPCSSLRTLEKGWSWHEWPTLSWGYIKLSSHSTNYLLGFGRKSYYFHG